MCAKCPYNLVLHATYGRARVPSGRRVAGLTLLHVRLLAHSVRHQLAAHLLKDDPGLALLRVQQHYCSTPDSRVKPYALNTFHPSIDPLLVDGAIPPAPAVPASTRISARLKRVGNTVHA